MEGYTFDLPKNINVPELVKLQRTYCYGYQELEPLKSRGPLRCQQIQIKLGKAHHQIKIEKYGILLLTQNIHTKLLKWSSYYELATASDLRIVLIHYGYYTYHKYSMSLSHTPCHTVYINTSDLLIPLTSEYSYYIKSIEKHVIKSTDLGQLIAIGTSKRT